MRTEQLFKFKGLRFNVDALQILDHGIVSDEG